MRTLLVVLCSIGLIVSWAAASGFNPTRSSECVDPSPTPMTQASGWDTLASSPTPTGRSAIGWIGDYVYVFGNEEDPQVALYWNVQTETWGKSKPHPMGGFNWTGAVAGGELYVLGRYDGTSCTNEFWRFTPDGTGGGEWTQLAPYPLSATLVAMGADEANGLIYAAGGLFDALMVYRNAHVYDIDANAWDSIPSLPKAKWAAGGSFANGVFYVVGGVDSVPQFYTNDFYAYYPDSGAWLAESQQLLYTLGFNWSSLATDGHILFQVGGGGGYGVWPSRDYVYYFHPDSGWLSLDALPVRYGTNSAVYFEGPDGPCLLSTGGWAGYEYSGMTFKLSDIPTEGDRVSNFKPPVSSLQLFQNYPNPFGAGGTIIQFKLQNANGKISLAVYDLSGRLIRNLLDGPCDDSTMQPSNKVVWDGRDAHGREVPPGVYFYRLTACPEGSRGAGEFGVSRKLVLVR